MESSAYAGLFRLGNYTAGDARRSTAACATGHGVNDNRGSTVAEDGVGIRAQSYIRSDGARVGRAARTNDERKVRDITCRRAHSHSFMHVPAAEMRTGGLEIGRLALRKLVNVEGVFTRREILDIDSDFYALGRGRESRSSDALALHILDVHS